MFNLCCMTEKALRELLQLINQQGEPVNPFEIRSYGKSELAMLYFPDAKTKKGAMNNLNYWINAMRKEICRI